MRDVLTSCFRAESPRSATGIALSGFCSTKFLLLFFGLCFSQRTSRGKSARARRKIEMILSLSAERVSKFSALGKANNAGAECNANSVKKNAQQSHTHAAPRLFALKFSSFRAI